MLHFVESADELEKNKMQYCIHRDEMVVGIGRPWKKSRVRTLPPSAYPRVVSNMGNLAKDEEKYKIPRMMMKYLFHFSTDIIDRNNIINEMDKNKITLGDKVKPKDAYFTDPLGNHMTLASFLHKMNDFYSAGISNTLGFAHPNSGDTMSSVMIGGLRTVMNGKWTVETGDKIQWYWTFEEDCFRGDGLRKSFKKYSKAGLLLKDNTGTNPNLDMLDEGEEDTKVVTDASGRRDFNDRQFGVKSGSLTPTDKASNVARVKTYIKDPRRPRLYDEMRVFARAIGGARPNEMVDIQICRQSM
jgi:hypothetical protein